VDAELAKVIKQDGELQPAMPMVDSSPNPLVVITSTLA
jgi:hypothetical protein